MSKKRKKQLYVVVKGHQPGVYTQWSGKDGAYEQVEKVPGAIYKGFYTREEAIIWLEQLGETTVKLYAPQLLDWIDVSPEADIQSTESSMTESLLQAGKYVIHTDGGAIKNPGPGGYGVVLRYKDHVKELSAGYRLTTNNRMELLACIEGLNALKLNREVVLFSDSKYVVNGITKGWAKRWRANGWMRNREEQAINADLWAQLLELCERYSVDLRWVKGHAGNPDNERCDELATEAIKSSDLLIDEVYEQESVLRSA